MIQNSKKALNQPVNKKTGRSYHRQGRSIFKKIL